MSIKPSFNLLPDMKIYSTNNSCATGTLDLIPTVLKNPPTQPIALQLLGLTWLHTGAGSLDFLYLGN